MISSYRPKDPILTLPVRSLIRQGVCANLPELIFFLETAQKHALVHHWVVSSQDFKEEGGSLLWTALQYCFTPIAWEYEGDPQHFLDHVIDLKVFNCFCMRWIPPKCQNCPPLILQKMIHFMGHQHLPVGMVLSSSCSTKDIDYALDNGLLFLETTPPEPLMMGFFNDISLLSQKGCILGAIVTSIKDYHLLRHSPHLGLIHYEGTINDILSLSEGL